MKITNVVGVLVLLSVVIILIEIVNGPKNPPFAIATMAGCYISPEGGNHKIKISSSGGLEYEGKSTSLSAYRDKVGLSILPADEVVATDKDVSILAGRKPFILRMDTDSLGFAVPSVTGKDLPFRRGEC